MSGLNRADLIERLETLGDESDTAVVLAARQAHRSIREAGLTWHDLLVGETSGEAMDDAPVDDADDAVPEPALSPASAGDDAALLDRLLARRDLSEDLRADLADLKRDMAGGEFTAMDSQYLRALATRLGA